MKSTEKAGIKYFFERLKTMPDTRTAAEITAAVSTKLTPVSTQLRKLSAVPSEPTAAIKILAADVRSCLSCFFSV